MDRQDARDRAEPGDGVLEQARAGDRAALEELLTRIHPLVLRWATVQTGDPLEADDLAQEALVRVARGVEGFRGESRFTSWLYRIVARTAVDRGRSARRRERREEVGGMRDEAEGTDATAGRDIDRDRLLARVKESFLALGGRQREVFELCELQGMDSAQAGELLGIAPATVRVTLLRARRRVREDVLKTDPELVEAFLS